MINLKSIANLVASNHTCAMSSSPEMTINANGDKEWKVDGKLHREDGPAIEYANGDKAWHVNGKHHREDGPAIEYTNGYKAWCLNGYQIEYDPETWDQLVNENHIKQIMNE